MMMPMATASSPSLPVKPIPGSYGLPVLGPLKDRLDYFWFQGPETFFRRRMAAHKSTVFRTNMPPTFPFFLGIDPRVVAVVDCASFKALFDNSLVDKQDVLVGCYSPSLSFTGGTRVAVYLDTTDPSHAKVKSFSLDLLRRRASNWVAEFVASSDEMLDAVEKDISANGKANVLVPLQKCIFGFLCKGFAGVDPAKNKEIQECGFAMLDKWLAVQLLPTTKVDAIPQPLGELLLHSFPLPFFLVGGDYKKLYEFIEKEGRDVLNLAETEYGLTTSEAINNILFILGFNAFGGFSLFLPSLLSTIGGKDQSALRAKLGEEVRRVLGDRELTFAAVSEMKLVRSVVYEVLRLNPPVPLQYGRAREGFMLQSHAAAYKVEKGELLCGYQPLAMRDPEIFVEPDKYVPTRFVDNEDLLKYLYWSNGPETGTPGPGNKQCAAKDHVVATACMLVAQIFKRYVDFECEGLTVKMLKRAPATAMLG